MLRKSGKLVILEWRICLSLEIYTNILIYIDFISETNIFPLNYKNMLNEINSFRIVNLMKRRLTVF